MSIFPDNTNPRLIHSCSADKSINTYDLETEKRVKSLTTTNGFHTSMTQRKDHELELITAGGGSPILFWDCDETQPVAAIQYPYKVTTLEISPSGKHLAFGTETNEVFVYSLKSLNEFTLLGKGLGHSAPVSKISWSPDEKAIISVSADHSISVWNFFGVQ